MMTNQDLREVLGAARYLIETETRLRLKQTDRERVAARDGAWRGLCDAVARCNPDNSTANMGESIVESNRPEPNMPVLNPTEDDLNDPLFLAIWQAIKGWDIEREFGLGYAGANGSDVMTILVAVRSVLASE